MDEGHLDNDDTVILLMIQNKRFSATLDFYLKLK
jgi:hypothetical protein